MIKKHSSALGLATVLVALAAIFGVSAHAAAASEVLTMSPTSVHPYVQPGATKTGEFQVVNQGQGSLQVHVYAAPYSVKSENYTPDFSPIPGKLPVNSWLHFSTSGQTINPNQALTVHYTLTVPKQTAPGGYYAVAFAETQLPKSAQGVVVNEQVGEIFYIRVAGPVRQSGKLLSWTSPFLQKPPLAATLRLENDGGVDYDSTIQLDVRDVFGRPKYVLSTDKEILPQTIRKIPISWAKTPSLGLFKVNGSYTVFGQQRTLPTHYVLVASMAARKVAVAIVILLILLVPALAIMRKLRRKRPRYKAKGS